MQAYKYGLMEGYHGDEHLIFDCEILEDEWYDECSDDGFDYDN